MMLEKLAAKVAVPIATTVASDGREPADPQVVVVVAVLDDVVLPEVVAEDGVERRDVGRHAGHERRQQTGDRQPQQAVGQQVAHQVEQRVVVGRRRRRSPPLDTVSPALRSAISVTSTAAIMPGTIVMNGTNILGNAADDGRTPGRADRVGGHRALHLDEVGRPVAEGQHEAEPEHDADDRQDRGVEAGQRLAGPGVQLLLGRRDLGGGRRAGGGLGDPLGQAVPARRPGSGPSSVSGSSAATITKNCSTSL